MTGSFIGIFLLTALGFFILYIVIETGVRRGIDSSRLGRFLEQKYGVKDDRKSFLDDDLDRDS